MSTPKIKLTELREYRSERTGSTYFAGYLGKTRVVMLRDDRAEITGKEVARWSLLLEEAEPRDERGPARGGSSGDRGGFLPDRERTSGASAPRSEGRLRPANLPVSRDRRSERASAERRAGEMLRERGIDTEAQPNDVLPF